MSKIILDDLTSIQNDPTAVDTINDNSAILEGAFDRVLFRDGTAPNNMEADLDMNSHKILNLPAPRSPLEPARLKDVGDAPTYAQDAAESAAEAAASAAEAAATAADVIQYVDDAEDWAIAAAASASAAAGSASSASTSAGTATTQAGIATTQAGIATTQAGTATTQAGIATTQAGNASTSATTATTQAGIATTQAGNASTSAGTATTQAGIATTQAGIATTQAGNAATSATQAQNYVLGLSGTSTTSLTIATGSKSFTASTGKLWVAGQTLTASSNANPANYMHGSVTSYNSGTGALVLNVLDIGGSGTLNDWNITVSGTQGPIGPQGPAGSGSGDVVGPASAVNNNVVLFDTTTGKLIKDGGKGIPTGAIVGTTDSQTLSGKTLTAPVVNSPTGIVKSDVGLGNVDNTSDSTKNAASVTLTNKTIDAANNTLTGVVLKATTGTITTGYTITPYNGGTQSSGTYTPNPANGNYQYYTNNGAHVLANPSSDCAIDILVTNGASAGTITFTTFTVGSNTGDALTTTNTSKFIISIRRINSISTYVIKALQ